MSERDVTEQVRKRYGAIATGASSGCCGARDDVARTIGYRDEDLAGLPDGVNQGLGCGAPLGPLAPATGEVVLDLGSGTGIDCFLAARAVGPDGRVIGIDMTPEMLDRARAHAGEIGADNVEFRQGRLESLPVDDASVDAVTSNCVINLVPDKAAVFREIARVLRPGGRLVVSDIVLDGALPDVVRDDVLAWTGCVAGAMPREAYFAALEAAGLGPAEILRDVDYLAATGFKSIPAELRERLASAGIRDADLEGVVRSVTYRARRGG